MRHYETKTSALKITCQMPIPQPVADSWCHCTNTCNILVRQHDDDSIATKVKHAQKSVKRNTWGMCVLLYPRSFRLNIGVLLETIHTTLALICSPNQGNKGIMDSTFSFLGIFTDHPYYSTTHWELLNEAGYVNSTLYIKRHSSS